MSLQVVSTVRRDNVQFVTKIRFSVLFWLTRTSSGANFHIGGRVCMQLFTYDIMSEIIGLTHAKDSDVYSLWKTSFWQLFDLHGRVRIVIFPWEDVSVYNLSHYFLCLGSTNMFPRSVSTTRRVHVRVHTLKDGCLLTFWVTKSFLCVTLNIWHHVGHQIFHRQVETMYNRMTILTNPSQYAIFHIQSHVWEQWFEPREGLWCVFTVKRRPSTQLFDLRSHAYA